MSKSKALQTLKEFGKKFFGTKKKVPEKFKTDLSKLPTSKNIDELIKNEGDPFVRNAYVSMREKAKKGTVVDKGGNVIGTPSKERSAKTLLDRNRGSKQFGKKSGGRIGLKAGSKGCKLAMKGKGRAYGKNS
tara:strand:+ start:87 stop:482 length:396 start_codon:yes stop_codon:yes gene_type:complete